MWPHCSSWTKVAARDDGQGCYEHTFEARLKEDRRKSAEPRPSTKLAQMYPKEKPYQAEQGEWLGLSDDLDPLIADNSILTDHENGVLVWSNRTIEKLKQSNIVSTLEDKQEIYGAG